jgi:hypothetical protein
MNRGCGRDSASCGLQFSLWEIKRLARGPGFNSHCPRVLLFLPPFCTEIFLNDQNVPQFCGHSVVLAIAHLHLGVSPLRLCCVGPCWIWICGCGVTELRCTSPDSGLRRAFVVVYSFHSRLDRVLDLVKCFRLLDSTPDFVPMSSHLGSML